jgi:hypothetical protein
VQETKRPVLDRIFCDVEHAKEQPAWLRRPECASVGKLLHLKTKKTSSTKLPQGVDTDEIADLPDAGN